MSKTFKLEIITPDGLTYSGDVESCVLPGLEGLFGVLPGHAPFISVLSVGEAKFSVAGKTEHLALSGGFAQVEQKQVRVLAETAELAEQIDVERAKAQADAKGLELKSTKLTTEQVTLVEASLLKELLRLKVADRYAKK
jgi:F-type H+-transporting ATPase subunit epsilon